MRTATALTLVLLFAFLLASCCMLRVATACKPHLVGCWVTIRWVDGPKVGFVHEQRRSWRPYYVAIWWSKQTSVPSAVAWDDGIIFQGCE